MIIDLKTLGDTPELSCDLCIVGSGAAGLAIASQMLPTPLTTLIVESGGLEQEPPTQALYDVDISGLPHPGSTQGRFRVCGGSTTQWGGQALPLTPLDFKHRDWVPHSGWPISLEELTPYYARASRFLLVDNMNFDTDLFTYLRTRPPDFDAQRVSYHFSKWSPKPSVREHYLPELTKSGRCTLLLHANVTRIVLERDLNRVSGIEVRSLQGQKTLVRARTFVLCVGGIETARLLLSNNEQQSNGIGNEYDLVGRFFQDHPSAMVGWLRTPHPARAQKLLNVFHKNGLKYSVRCTATPQLQRDQRMLNISMGTTFVENNPALQDVKDIYLGIRRRQFSGVMARKLLRAASRPSGSILPVWQYLARGRSYAPGARMQIGLTSEQQPNPDSRVLLSDKMDALGIRRSNVRWKLTDGTRHTIRQFAKVLQEEFQRAGIGEIDLEEWVLNDSLEWANRITDQFHHMGTTRMSESPRLGVVDGNCKVHGVENLYIGSSAVFPTGGHSNPTLTIIALCLRLADRLKTELT
jgi:choline dehydrogenase-like flavoprotein